MRYEFSPEGLASMARFFGDQAGMHAINDAVRALADDPEPPWPLGVHHGDGYHRLHVGRYRVMYEIAGDLITVRHVGRARG